MYVMVLVSLTVEVMVVVDSPIWLVTVNVVSKTEVETPVLVEVAGAEVMLTFKPPVGRAWVALLVLKVHSLHVLLAPKTLEVVSPETSVALVVVQTDQVLLPA